MRLDRVLNQPHLHGELLDRVQRPAWIAHMAQSRPQFAFERRIANGRDQQLPDSHEL